MKKILKNNKGQALGYLLGLIFLAYFAATITLFLLHREGLFRFEFGKENEEEIKEIVFDKNKVLELFKREELVEEQAEKNEVEEIRLESVRKELEIERAKLAADNEELRKAMAEITEKFKKLSEEEELNLRRLAKLYEEMKAPRVAKIFSEMDEVTVAQLLTRMQNKSAAKILGEIGVVDPERAAQISNIIKGKFKRDAFEKIGT